VTETGRLKKEAPQDREQLAALREARACGDIEGEKQAIARLIGGWLGKAEAWLAFKGVDSEHRKEIVGRWSCGLVKALKENDELPHAFGAIAMKRIAWARAEYFRQTHRQHERSSEDPLAERDELGRGEDEIVIDHLLLKEALGQISERDQEVIEAAFLMDLSAAEAGARLGLSEGALRTAKTRAVHRLRSEFGLLGVTNSS
jgi:RNA polymerase sigma factor (sigma-70 family)